MCRRQSIGLRQLLAYGVGHVLNDICASMWFTYLLVYFHFVLLFENWHTGLLMLIGQVADALATPFVGFYSDRSDNSWLCKYGKRKTWHLFGSVCVVAAFPFIFSPCIGCETSPKYAQLFYYSAFIIIFQFGWAAVQISHLSLIPELTLNENDRTKLTAVRYVFTVFSNLLVYVITWSVLNLNEDSESQIKPSDSKKFQYVVGAGLGVGVLCTFIFHCFVHEKDEGNANMQNNKFRAGIKDIFCSLKLYQTAAIYMSTRLFLNLSQMFIPLYLHDTLNMAAQALAILPLTVYLSSFVACLCIEYMNRKLGRKVSYILGGVTGMLACAWVQLAPESQLVSRQIYGIAVLFGVGGSVILVTSLGITADLIGQNTGNGAFIYGLMSFTDKLANGLGVVVIQYLYNGKNYYRDVLTYVCGSSILFGVLSVLLTRKSNEKGDYTRLEDSCESSDGNI